MTARALEESARAAGQCSWLERRLFEVLGGWVRSVAEPEVKAAISTQSFRHAWHAELFDRCVPRVPAVVPEAAIAPTPELTTLLDAVARPEGALERVVGLYGVLLPWMLASYGAELGACDPVADGPLIRALCLARSDELDDQRRGEGLMRSLIRSPAHVERAAAHQESLTGLLPVYQ